MSKIDQIIATQEKMALQITRIEASLFPDGFTQPGRLAKLETNVNDLKAWRNYLSGAWAILVFLFGWVIRKH